MTRRCELVEPFLLPGNPIDELNERDHAAVLASDVERAIVLAAFLAAAEGDADT
jgi:hypothetical protein